MRRVPLTLVVVATLLVAGCASGMGSSSEPTYGAGGADQSKQLESAPATAAAGGDAGDQQADSEGGSSGKPDKQAAQRAQRALIKTGKVRLEVSNYSKSRQSITALARGFGGFVSDSGVETHQRDNETWRTGYVVVRVPSSNFTEMVDAAKRQGTVLSASTSTRDVTEKLVDLNARIKNLKRERKKLRELYAQANDTAELLKIREQLSRVQGEIERLEAKRRSLKNKVALSTLRVELTEPEPEPSTPTTEPFHEQSPVEVLQSSVANAVVFVRTVALGFIALTPWLLLFGIPLGLIAVVGRRLGLADSVRSLGSREGSPPQQAYTGAQPERQVPATGPEPQSSRAPRQEPVSEPPSEPPSEPETHTEGGSEPTTGEDGTSNTDSGEE